MKLNLSFKGIIKNGKVALNSPDSWSRALLGFREDEKITVTIATQKKFRSLSHNAYYWVYLKVISDETGDDANSLHEFFRRKFLAPKFIKAQGETIKIPQSTTELSTSDFNDYLMRINAVTSIPMPDPEAAGYIPNKGMA